MEMLEEPTGEHLSSAVVPHSWKVRGSKLVFVGAAVGHISGRQGVQHLSRKLK